MINYINNATIYHRIWTIIVIYHHISKLYESPAFQTSPFIPHPSEYFNGSKAECVMHTHHLSGLFL